MAWRAGRFARVHVVLGTLMCTLLGAAVIVRQVPKNLPAPQPPIPVKLKRTPFSFPNLKLKRFDLIESGVDLRADFHASAFLKRPGAIVPRRALCLRDLEKKTERDVTEGQPIFLKQEQGRLTFAHFGEKTPLWALPERAGDAVSLDIYAHIQGEDHWIKRVEIPFDDAKPWPKRGITIQGLLIDETLFERLGARWYGRNRLDPSRGERLCFDRVGTFCYAKKGEWFSLNTKGFGPIETRKTKYEPVIQLKEIGEKSLEFEVVDADAQFALRLILNRTPESFADASLQSLSFLGRRQADSAYLESEGKFLTTPFGSVIFFANGRWSKEERPGPALRIDRIEKGALIATLFSAGRSLEKSVTLPPGGL